MREGARSVNALRTKPVRIDARFVFVEKDPGVVRYLREVLLKRGDVPSDDGVIRLLRVPRDRDHRFHGKLIGHSTGS